MLLLNKKQVSVLITLTDQGKEWYLSNLSDISKVTYVHTTRIIKEFERQGIVSIERHGKIKRILLTDKGRRIAERIYEVMNELNNANNVSANNIGVNEKQPLQ